MVGICKIRGLIPMEIVAGKRPLSNVQLSWMWRRCRGREKRVVSGGKEREREVVLLAKRRFKAPEVAGVIKKRPKVSSLCHLLPLNRQTQARCQLNWKGRHQVQSGSYNRVELNWGSLQGLGRGPDRGLSGCHGFKVICSLGKSTGQRVWRGPCWPIALVPSA